MTRYSVIAHSDCFTIREDGTGDILTFPLSQRERAHSTCDLMNRAHQKGYSACMISLAQETSRNPVRRGYPTGAHDVSDRVTETWRNNAAREGWETTL